MDDRFDEMIDQMGNDMNQRIYIQMVERRGRKSNTLVKGIPDQFDLKKIVRFWKKVPASLCKNFHCLGSIEREGEDNEKKDKENREQRSGKQYIKVSGDQRKQIEMFLIYMGIAHKENIRILSLIHI